GTVTTGAVPNLGADDFFADGAGALGQLTANLAVGGVVAWFDTLSLNGADNIGDGGIAREQDYMLTFTNAGTYSIKMWFTNSADVDLFLVDNTYSTLLGQSFLGNGLEETITFTATAGQSTVLTINMFAGTIPPLARIMVTRTS
ncbi:MAG TPA: hypothetical protein VG712_04625, partial [Gemmatimonadales bacterium]|nr:hypothetical protein [Gemmatimonadales bacterium]